MEKNMERRVVLGMLANHQKNQFKNGGSSTAEQPLDIIHIRELRVPSIN